MANNLADDVTPNYADEEELLRRGGGGIASPTPQPRPLPSGPTGTGGAPSGIARPPAALTPPVSLRGISPSTEQRVQSEGNEINRLQSTGSGISQIKNPWARNSLRVLDTIGSIGAPGLTANIPGTELHHRGLLGQERGKLGQDLREESAEAGLGKTQAETGETAARIPLTQAQTAKTEAETAAAGQPKPKEEKWSVNPHFTDVDGTPLRTEENSGQTMRLDGKPATGFKAVAPSKEEKQDPTTKVTRVINGVPHEVLINGRTGEDIKDEGQTKLAQDTSGKVDARADKSYQYNNNKLDTLAKPIEDATARMGRLQETLRQGSPQADALVAPELLTIMAGGAGSGLRMNEAEISRIVGGRSKWQSLEASINQWRTDPAKANSITPEQRQQIRALVDAVNVKLQKKQQALDQARDDLLNSDDPKEHRKIVTGAHHSLTQVDEATGGGAGVGGGQPVYATNPKTKERVMTTDGGKTWQPAQ